MKKDTLFLRMIIKELNLNHKNSLLFCKEHFYIFIRQYLYYLLYESGLKLKEIGSIFYKTHASIINGLRNHEKDENYSEYIEVKKIIDNNKLIKNFIEQNYKKELK